MAVTFRFVWPGRIDRYATAKPARNIGLAECPQLDRKPNSTARIFYEVSIMNPRYDVFRNLEGNEVRFLGTAATLEEAEQLARSQKLSSGGAPCFVLFSAFGNSSRVAISI